MYITYTICIIVAFLACTFGRICGIGGGIIIKPVLDSMGFLDASSISYLSGCTVLLMTTYSLVKNICTKNVSCINSTMLLLSIGAAFGGIAGKKAFSAIAKTFFTSEIATVVQSIVLMLCVLGTIVYTCQKDKLKPLKVTNLFVSLIIGLSLGFFSSFLGIGGGPFNMAVLFFFYSMEVKTAVITSLFVIFVSQLTSLSLTILTKTVPDIPFFLLFIMGAAGILGGIAGDKISNKLDNNKVTKLFMLMMILTVVLCLYNAVKYLIL